ncbi:MAG: TolC family protein, partial [Flammeovirgaceae bacterium]
MTRKFTISLTLICQFSFGQINDDFIPNIDSLKSSCIHFYAKRAIADLTAYNYKIKWQVLNYLPSPGWNVATNSPILQINFGDIFRAVNLRRQNVAQARRIILYYESEMNAALIEVTQLHQSLVNQLHLYNSSIKVLELEKQKFDMVEKDYTNTIIPPSEYLTAQIAFSTLQNNLNIRLFDLQKAKAELLIKAKK